MTRYAYVLTSPKNDGHPAMCLISALSVRSVDPLAKIAVFSDQATLAKLRRSRHQLLEVADEFWECPVEGTPSHTSRSIKTTLLQRLHSDFVYLDVDTIVLHPITDRLQEPHSVQLALDRTPGVAEPCFPVWFAPQFEQLGWPWPTSHYYNSGVMIVRADTASEALFDEWHRRWRRFLSCGMYYDQPALNSSIHALETPVGLLPVPYNAMVRVEDSFRQGAKVLHFFAEGHYKNASGNAKGTKYMRLIAAAAAGHRLTAKQISEVVHAAGPLVEAGEVRRERAVRVRRAWLSFCQRMKDAHFFNKSL